MDLIDIHDITTDGERDAALALIRKRRAQAHLTEAAEEKLKQVRKILMRVRKEGDEAVADLTERFDGVLLKPSEFEVREDEISAAMQSVDPALLDTFRKAHDNITRFHEQHLRESWEERHEDGTIMGQRITPVASAGVYVPGGKALYPSSVLMNIVPAKVAGVRDIVMVSPPSFQGAIHPMVLAAARIAGATRIFRIGGAQAIAALAYGTDHIPNVLKITGPGNVFVTLAKRLVAGICDIDKEAGPSEVVVIADESADPELAAAELLAQGEHEEEARAMLVTTSREQAEAILECCEKAIGELTRGAIIREAFAREGLCFAARDALEAALLTNEYAPEHLSIQTENPRAVLEQIPDVGCAVLGQGTSVACGDYFAGPNHILPTDRSARFASPLTAEDFRKVTSILQYSPERMQRDAEDIVRFAKAEQFTAHARAVELRR